MRKIFLLCLLMPLLAIGQKKNVVNATRVFPKIDKVLEFEKALAAHAQKYHNGDWKWRVFEIQSGPDAGGYHITEGPVSWEQIDNRGNLGTEHNLDWHKNIAPFLTEKYVSTYSIYQDTLSTVAVTDYASKINITHWYPKPGWGYKIREVLVKMKKAWEAGNESIAVYTSSSSGEAQFAVVTRYKQGLKEREEGFRKALKERFETIYGEDSWDLIDEMVKNYVDHFWSELLFLRADLSSK
ncbi:MAG TPA: hypothetical protein PKC39_06060 [Ferruginibacter sp.]|nr:hypothetical protein [Ferruginibacter sp.]HMP20506.1 hypothetical protein [Ferruginibacter sp.]